MNVKSTAGDKSSDIVEVGSYVTIPAASDMGISNSSGTDLTISPYRDEISPANGPLPIFTDNASRVLTDENGNPISYWLRSPTVNGNAWIHIINYQGYLYPWQNPATYIDNSNNTTYIYIRPLLSI